MLTLVGKFIEDINIDELLEWCPHGLFFGCSSSANYFVYMFRNKPTLKEYNECVSQRNYWNVRLINPQKYSLIDDTQLIINEINKRLQRYNYVKVSIYSNEKINENNNQMMRQKVFESIIQFVDNPSKQKLFDHSFVIASKSFTQLNDFDSKNIIRFESYLNNYAPRAVEWNNYEEDLVSILSDNKNTIENWNSIFGVDAESVYSRENVEILIEN